MLSGGERHKGVENAARGHARAFALYLVSGLLFSVKLLFRNTPIGPNAIKTGEIRDATTCTRTHNTNVYYCVYISIVRVFSAVAEANDESRDAPD